MITRVSSVIRPEGSDPIFDHPYNDAPMFVKVFFRPGIQLVRCLLRVGHSLGKGRSLRRQADRKITYLSQAGGSGPRPVIGSQGLRR